MKKSILIFVLFLTATLNGINAQDANNPWVIGFGTNAVHNPNTREDLIKTSDWNVIPSISKLSIARYIEDGFTFEVAGTLNEITKNNGLDIAALSFAAVDGHFKYDINNLVGNTKWFDPYVFMGGGYTWVDWKGAGTFNAGAGFNLWFTENIGFNIQTAGKHAFNNFILDENHWQHSAGLVIKFGGKDTDKDGIYDKFDACPEIPGLPQFKGCPDTDSDGIQDSEDACPTIAGLAEFQGCPDTDGDGIPDNKDGCPKEKGTKANNGCPDTDGDGLIDKDDACPTVAGPKENKGCPWPDTDGDGVLDKDDNCPKEVGPASNNGCPETLKEFAKVVYFNLDSAKLNEGVDTDLNEVVALLNKFKEAKFLLEGHADDTGSAKYNDKLSLKRVTNIKDYLVAKGIDAARFTANSFGETKPASPNKTKEGRAKNRRVEISLIK